MKIASKVADRKKLVKALENVTGLSAKYLYAPSFCFEIGPYTVDRAGTLTVTDQEADMEVLKALAARELIDLPEEESEDMLTIISLPMAKHDGRSLKNLVFLLHSKSTLLSKAVGRLGFYKIDEKLIRLLDKRTPGKTEDFLETVSGAGEDTMRGITFEDGKIGICFPFSTDPEQTHTYMQLATLMVKMAKDQKRVQPDRCKVTNEKYTFRVWLMRLGMKGDEYKTARKLLLQNLNGHAAFRTKDQEEAAREKLRRQREAEREVASETAFEEL